MDAHEHNLVHPLSPRDNVSDFFQAVGRGDVDKAARFLRNGWNVQTRNEYGHSAIHDAVKNNDLSMVQLLIDFGANVNEIHEALLTPLHYAAKYRDGAVVKLLLENGADPDIASEVRTLL